MDQRILRRQIEAIQQAAYVEAQLIAPSRSRFAYSKMVLAGTIECCRSEKTSFDALLGIMHVLKTAAVYQARQPISVHEIPQHYGVLMIHVLRLRETVSKNFDEISQFFAAHDMRISPFDTEDVFLATIPAAEPNAYVKRLPQSNRILILFNLSIIPMICAISRLAAESAEITVAGAFSGIEYNRSRSIEKVLELGPAFQPLVTALRGVIYGDVTKLVDMAGRPPPPANRVFRALCDAMIAYVIAHEFGHVMLGHLSDEQQTNVQRIPFLIGQEHEADAFAFLMNILGQKQSAISGGIPESDELVKSSALTAFGAQDLLLRAFWTIEAICHYFCGTEGNKTRITSHPAYGDRLDLLKRTAIDVVPDLKDVIEKTAGAHQDLVQVAADVFIRVAEQEGFGTDVAPYLRAALGV
jgi:hypothetical protein